MNTKVQIPTDWRQIKLEIGMKIFSIERITGDTETVHNKYFEDAAACFDIDLEEITIEERKELWKRVFELLAVKPTTEFNTEFIIHGKRYVLDKNFRKMSWSIFRDRNILLERTEKKFWPLANLILAMLIRPAVKKKTYNPFKRPEFIPEVYSYDSVEERAELFAKTLTVADINGIAVFFYLIMMRFLRTTITSSMRKAQDIPMTELKNTEKSTDGKAGLYNL